ncbi:MAG: GNAT family N-acetyltransferase [Deltaproteobacteria bacterium]|nr:GNAT family N-acetyltransferase [Deltaproteobacteria bacterium]
MTWQHKPWSELHRDELYAILALRQRVFVVEHQRPCLDADGADPLAWHLSLGDRALHAYLRWFAPGIRCAEANFGRVVTAGEVRGTGLGRALVAEGLARIHAHHGPVAIRITAQQYLERFYAQYAFVRASDIVVIDGIDHVEMLRPAQ